MAKSFGLARVSGGLLAVITGGLAALVIGEAAPALARCAEREWYDITSATSIHMPAAGTSYKDGPGGTITVAVQRASTISATASVSSGAATGGIVQAARTEVSNAAATSNQITVGHSYSRTITSNRYGNVVYGAWGYQVNWRYGVINADCTSTQLTSGTGAKVPTTQEGWRYWETGS